MGQRAIRALENYVLDVVRNVDHRFATHPQPPGRGIAGLSEGAFGALNISLHNLRHLQRGGELVGLLQRAPIGAVQRMSRCR